MVARELSWDDCITCRSARSITPRHEQAASLREIARERLAFLGTPKLTSSNATFVLETQYTATLEMVHAHLLSHGFLVENHLCIAYYLRDVRTDERLFGIFDEARLRRNALVYYGQHTDVTVCERLIRGLAELRVAMEAS